MAAAWKRRPRARWLHSSRGTRPDSTCSRMIFETPHGRPIDIHAVTTRSTAPATIMSSPSVHMRFRTSVRRRRRWRRISRTSAIGVREKRQPPAATVSPSRTRRAASSTELSFSPDDLGLVSSRRRASRKSQGAAPAIRPALPSGADSGPAPRPCARPAGARGPARRWASPRRTAWWRSSAGRYRSPSSRPTEAPVGAAPA